MALIVCPECREKVSDTADNCPKCGFKLKVSRLGWLWAVGVFLISSTVGEITGNPFYGLGAFIGMVIAFFILRSKASDLQQKIDETNKVAQEGKEGAGAGSKSGKIIGNCFYCGGNLRVGDEVCPDCGRKV